MIKAFLPFILLIVSVWLFFGYVDNRYAEIKLLRAEAGSYDTALNRSQELLLKRKELTEKYNSMSSENLTKIEKLLPDTVDSVRLILDINSIASKYGLTIKGIKMNDTSGAADPLIDGGKKHNTLSMSFSVDASYAKFVSFIKDLEQSLRIIDVTSIDFEATNVSLKKGSEPVYKIGIGLNTYWLK